MLSLLSDELDERRRVLGDARVGTLSAVRALGGRQHAAAGLLLDDYAGLHSAFGEGSLFCWITAFQRRVTDGRHAGTHVVMTATREIGIPPIVLSAITAQTC